MKLSQNENPYQTRRTHNPKTVFLPGLLSGLFSVLLVLGLVLVARAPNEATMGLIQRIFYIHVPCAMMAFALAFVAGGAGILVLLRRSLRAYTWLVTALELAILFGLCVLITGPLWGRKAWGVWWAWDARLTTTLLLWFTVGMARFAYAYGGPMGPRLAAGLAIFGMCNVPFVYFSVSLWRTVHPKAKVVWSLSPGMRLPFWTMVLAISLLTTVLFMLRLRLAQHEARTGTLSDNGENS